MRNLINFLLRHSSWIVLAIYVAISCVLLFGRNPYQRSIYLSSANQVASAVYDLQSEVTSYFGLREVNRDLQLRNGELEMEVINLKEQLNRYRSSVGKDTIPFDSVLHDYDFAVARVVNNSVAQINNYITIDKGRAEGIEIIVTLLFIIADYTHHNSFWKHRRIAARDNRISRSKLHMPRHLL